MVEPSFGTLLVTSIRFAELAAARQVATRLAAIALPPITLAADIESLATSRGTAKPLTEDEFQRASRPFPKEGLDNGRRSWQARRVQKIKWLPNRLHRYRASTAAYGWGLHYSRLWLRE